MARRFVFAAIALWLISGVAQAQTPYDEVVGSPHNFLGSAVVHEVCLGCHLGVENKDAESAYLAITPQWGGEGGLNGAYAVGKRNPDGTFSEFPDTSTACMECHDGVLAKAVHTQGLPVTTERGGSRMRNHPQGIAYPRDTKGDFVVPTPLPQNRQFWSIPDLNAENGLTLPSGPTSTYQSIPADSDASVTANLVRTRNGEIHCESCHNPHSDKVRPFLRAMPPTLCLVCHDK